MLDKSILLILVCNLLVGCNSMSTTYRDQWLKLRKVHKTEKIRRTITIPAFSVNCGPAKNSLFHAFVTCIGASVPEYTDLISIEGWVKIPAPSVVDRVVYAREVAGTIQYDFWVMGDGTLLARFRQGGATQTFTSTDKIPFGDWCFVSMVWDGATVQFFVNAVKITGGAALVAPIDALVGDVTVQCTGGINRAYIDEVRVWNEDRAGILYHDGTNADVSDKIRNSMLAPRNETPGDGIDDLLIAYLKFGLLADYITGDVFALTIGTGGGLVTDEGAPLRYGASFICNRFTCVNTQKSSLIYPIEKPEDVDFMLCVSWEDDDGNTQRRRLWDMDGVDINPMPAKYAGDTLPATFYFEIWNIDGNATATLSEAITIYSSVTSDPVDATDRTSTSLLTPTESSALADPFPLGLPGSYNTQQTY